jgi:hypothetical protein
MYLWEDPRPPFLLLTDLQNGLPTVDGVFGDNKPFPQPPLVRQNRRSRGIPESIKVNRRFVKTFVFPDPVEVVTQIV